jgi:predicted nucleic acid-binding protein
MKMLQLLIHAFDSMRFFSIRGFEEEILELSLNLQISYYDSAYLHIAQRDQIPLITEDKSMQKKATILGLDSFSIKDV